MSVSWKVTHTLVVPASVAARVAGYSNLGISFTFTPEGKLHAVEHTLNLADGTTALDAERDSDELLRPLWDAFNFRHGVPLAVATRTAQRIGLTGSLSGALHGSSRLSGTVTAVAAIRFPHEASIASASGQLGVYLFLANSGRDTRDAAHALRNYYMILEDVFGTPMPGSELEKVKWARDFVSHPRIDSPNARKFLEAELGMGTTRYDPRAAAHVSLVEKWRNKARMLAEAEIERLL